MVRKNLIFWTTPKYNIKTPPNHIHIKNQNTPPTRTTSIMASKLSCLGHVKRVSTTENGTPTRPPAPGLYSDTCFHGDNSGSMASMGRAPEDGGRNFAKQYRDFGKANSGETKTHLTYGVFSTEYHQVFSDDPAKLTESQIDQCAHAMRPTASTKFYDTAIAQLNAQAARVRAEYASLAPAVRRLVPMNQFAAVVFATLTDGMDNQSVICDEAALKRAFARHKQEFGATIMFIAANMNAEQIGQTYGLDGGDCLQMGSDQHYSQAAFQAVTSACLRGCSGAPPPPRSLRQSTFTGLERVTSCSATEANRYGVKLGGRQCTAPVKGSKGSFVQPKGSPAVVPPPPPPLNLRGGGPFQGHFRGARGHFGPPPLLRNYGHVNLRQTACGGGGGGRGCTSGVTFPPVQLHVSSTTSQLPPPTQLPLSDDDLSDSDYGYNSGDEK